ncbi:hypothetical protein [Actinomadura chokoriensis]|uniref:Uncharacterized protein n=1 Tax=Actinomadura chokoriensis TaxID=454156 RepID=A0ABV4QW57_9ACTN
MRDSRRPPLPGARLSAARLLVVLLGMLGFVAGPVGTAAHGGTPPTGTISGVRTVPAQKAPARTRASTKPRTTRHAQAAVAWHAAGAATPSAQPASAALPVSGAAVPPPPAGRPGLTATGPASPDLAPRAVPRGRAPPSTTRI